jgi:hypothetical protein
MRLFLIFATLAGLAIYGVSLQAPYYLDDVNVLETARRLSFGIRPLGYLSFWLNNYVYEAVALIFPWRAPAYFRAVNVLIHILCSGAVFWLARELSGRKTTAFVAGSVFLVHPVQTQAVTYITQRFESLAALFMICAAAAYVRFRREGGWPWLLIVLLTAVAAGAVKETGLILPLWLAFIEVVFFSKKLWNARLFYGLPLLAVVAWPAWKTWLQSGPTLTWIPWRQYLGSQGFVLAKYMQLVVFPAEQFLLYDIQPATGISLVLVLQWLLVVIVLGMSVWILRMRPLIGFGAISFFILLLPVTILPLPDLIFEHRIYPALCGFAIALGAAVSMLPKRLMTGVAGLVLVLFAAKTVYRNMEYNDPIAFFESHRERFPAGAFALVHLGNHYLGMGEVNKALAVTEEARSHENRFNAYYQKVGRTSVATNLGLIHLAKQEYAVAETEAFRALAVTPDDPLALLLLGNIYIETDRAKLAKTTLAKLVDRTPDDVAAWRWYLESCLNAGDTKCAATAQLQINNQSEAIVRRQADIPRIPSRYRHYVVFLTAFLSITMVFATLRYLISQVAPAR